MLYLKKYFTEGLIQMAILLSLCGVRVDVGLEPYLLPSWHEMILGPTSALTQTQFHNLRNRLEDGHGLHPKSVDLDGFFTARRLLGWVRSLDRLQVPRAELEAWLVQREPDPLPMGCPDQSSPLERAAGVERDRPTLPVESRDGLGAVQDEDEEDKEEDLHQYSGTLEERGEEESEEHLNGRTEGRGRPGGFYSYANNREQIQNEVDQTSSSLQECLRLLENTFPFTEEQQIHDDGGRREDLECQPLSREPLLSHIIPNGNPLMDLELQWQDLLEVMEPENTDVDMMTQFEHNQNLRTTGNLQGAGSEALNQNCNNSDNGITVADQEVFLMESPLQNGLLGPPSQPAPESALLPLIPSAELDDHNSALNTRDTKKNSNVNPSHTLPDNTQLLEENPSEDFGIALNAEDNSSTFNINMLTQGLVDTMEGNLCTQYAPSFANRPSLNVNFHSLDMAPSSFNPSSEGNGMAQDLLTSPSNVFLGDEEDDVDDDDGLPSTLSDLLEDATILDEIRLLDLALEDGFGPEMAAKLEEEGFLNSEVAQQETGRDDDHSGSSVALTENQGQLQRHHQDSDDEADSDSGLSLDFSHSPASPCASEASSYSSSSTSSSSCVSALGSPFSEAEDEAEDKAEEGLLGADMEVEVTIKQEELEEEEMGAVGGEYPEDVKKPFFPNRGDHKLYNGFPWLEYIGHDHTYNQPVSSVSSPYLGKMPNKQPKTSLRHDSAKPYHRSSSRRISETMMWSRDEQRAQARKIPFSNELIVNLPVDEFNDLLASYQLSEEQLTLIRDIRRRGKNKIAAQNCRKRKLDVLLDLEDSVSGLRRHRSRLLREKQEALRNLQEMKRRLGMLYQDVFSRLRDEEGRPLNAMEYLLQFESNGGVTVASRQETTALPLTKNSKKQKDKKK
ncbi:endoplasmic reticulum membrane sensor NFE2L1-like [Epinephelus moara]|uniref:endoplasmic reticulum membrane sensor NFE2L1-like n=1 Tax=Epinephelus moara TaxID=300413 RepID=UPI00214E0BCE|nr:endoplasmic reticulum membrane sensor NFE2L1-like [Epinephelus moara]XP_049924175.1 endoplasmic reticulum membrane sensor NFE2L1-like [Epinephelus moara]